MSVGEIDGPVVKWTNHCGAVNDALADQPGVVNTHPEGAGWFLKLKVANKADFDALMDGEAYSAFLETVED